jgi:hypothetical protein
MVAYRETRGRIQMILRTGFLTINGSLANKAAPRGNGTGLSAPGRLRAPGRHARHLARGAREWHN